MAGNADVIFKVKTDVLLTASDEVEEKLSRLRLAFQSIEQTVQASWKYWEGEGHDMHVRSYRDKMETIQKALNRFQEHVTDLKEIAGVYTQAEQTILGTNQELEVDMII